MWLFLWVDTLTLKREKNRFTLFRNQELEHVFEEKYLGVLLNVDLKCRQANSEKFLISRWPTFQEHFHCISKTHLEYGRVISSSYLKTYFIVKNVQRHTAKLVDGYKSLKYTERLKRLDLSSHWDVQALSQLRHN